LLIYASGTVFLYAFAMDLPEEERKIYWNINLICTVLKNLLFTVAILINAKHQKKPPPDNSIEHDYRPYLN